MREISIASQVNLEKSYVRMLMKVIKGVAKRRFCRETTRNHYHAWRHRTENRTARSVLQRAFRLLFKITTRQVQAVLENWAWEAGHTRTLDRKCHLFAMGQAWGEQTMKNTCTSSRNLFGASAGLAVPRLRRLLVHLVTWKAEAWTKQDLWRHRILQRFLAHKVLSAWANTMLESSCIRHNITRRLVSKVYTAGQELVREALVEWHCGAKQEQKQRRQHAVAVLRCSTRSAYVLQQQGFAVLQNAARGSVVNRKAAMRVVRTLMHASMVHYIHAWIEHSNTSKIQQQQEMRCKRILQRLLWLGEKQSFVRWTEYTSAARENAQKIVLSSKLLARVMMSGATLCWNLWMEYRAVLKTQQQQEMRGNKILRRLLRLGEKQSFMRWTEYTSGVRRKAQKIVLSSKVLARIMMQRATLCWDLWMDHLAILNRQRQQDMRGNTILQRILYLGAKQTFLRWTLYTLEARWKAQKIVLSSKVLARIMLQGGRQSFVSWKYYCVEAKSMNKSMKRAKKIYQVIMHTLTHSRLAIIALVHE